MLKILCSTSKRNEGRASWCLPKLIHREGELKCSLSRWISIKSINIDLKYDVVHWNELAHNAIGPCFYERLFTMKELIHTLESAKLRICLDLALRVWEVHYGLQGDIWRGLKNTSWYFELLQGWHVQITSKSSTLEGGNGAHHWSICVILYV